MTSRLLPDWKKIVRRAWSLRLAMIAALFSGAEVVLPMFTYAMPSGVFAGLSFVTAVGATIARIVAQPEMHE